MTRAFNVAKRVRSETDIGESAVSVSYAAVELAREIFGSLNGQTRAGGGRGQDGGIRGAALAAGRSSEILVTNRTRERADALAEEFQGRVVDYDEFFDSLPEVDIVIASSGAPHYIITQEQMQRGHRTPQQPADVPDRHRGAAQHRARRE